MVVGWMPMGLFFYINCYPWVILKGISNVETYNVSTGWSPVINQSNNSIFRMIATREFFGQVYIIMQLISRSVSEIKDFSDAHIECMDPKTMHPAKYLCTFPYMIILNLQKRHAFPGALG